MGNRKGKIICLLFLSLQEFQHWVFKSFYCSPAIFFLLCLPHHRFCGEIISVKCYWDDRTWLPLPLGCLCAEWTAWLHVSLCSVQYVSITSNSGTPWDWRGHPFWDWVGSGREASGRSSIWSGRTAGNRRREPKLTLWGPQDVFTSTSAEVPGTSAADPWHPNPWSQLGKRLLLLHVPSIPGMLWLGHPALVLIFHTCPIRHCGDWSPSSLTATSGFFCG